MDDCFYTGIVRRNTDVDIVDFDGIRPNLIPKKCSYDKTIPVTFVSHFKKTPYALLNGLARIKRQRCGQFYGPTRKGLRRNHDLMD